MNIGYIRVSTIEQNDERQYEGLKKHNIDKFYTEKVSAKTANRPQLQTMLDFAREGDSIFVHDFSRLARSTKDLLDIIEFLKNKNVKLVSNKESFDTSTPSGKLMLTVMGAIYEFERTNMLERQREGIAIAKAEGRYKGKKPIEKPKNWNDVYSRYKNRTITGKQAIKETGLKRNTFYKFVKEESNNESKTNK